MYLAGRNKVFVKHLGGDADFLEKLGKYFGCMTMGRGVYPSLWREMGANRNPKTAAQMSDC